ncbi:MAG TPA: hypothetical protein V6D43_20240 [Candidatus Sericytochromatia bacterium]|jgi:hypothetical protein
MNNILTLVLSGVPDVFWDATDPDVYQPGKASIAPGAPFNPVVLLLLLITVGVLVVVLFSSQRKA